MGVTKPPAATPAQPAPAPAARAAPGGRQVAGVPPRNAAPARVSDAELSELVAGLQEGSPTVLESARGIRLLVSRQQDAPLQRVIDTGCVSRLIQLLAAGVDNTLRHEACWSITNLVGGTTAQVRQVVEHHNALPPLVAMLSEHAVDLREQACWAVSNIAGDCAQFRDAALAAGALQPLLAICAAGESNVGGQSTFQLLRNATWAISNLCRGKPQPEWSVVLPALVPLVAMLSTLTDGEALGNACFALSYLADDKTATNEKIAAVLGTGCARRLVELMTHSDSRVRSASVQTMGSLAAGDDQQTQLLLDAGMLPPLRVLLTDPKPSIRKMACFTVSNVTGGTRAQCQAVLDCGMLPPLINILRTDNNEVQKEAVWCISNLCNGCSDEGRRLVISSGVIRAFADLLTLSDGNILLVILEGLERLLRQGKEDASASASSENAVATQLEECNGLDRLEELQNHQNEDVYNKAVSLLENFFDAEEDDQGEAGAAPRPPQSAGGGGFTFGASTAPQQTRPAAPPVDPEDAAAALAGLALNAPAPEPRPAAAAATASSEPRAAKPAQAKKKGGKK